MSILDFFRPRRPAPPAPTQSAREAVDHSEDDRGWRRGSFIGGTPLNPERDELDGEALLREAYLAYRANPIAYAVIEQTASFVIGGGVRVVAADHRVQKVIDEFWNDPANDMPLRVHALQTELSIFGEQFIRFYVDQLTGRTLIRQLDPLSVKEIKTHPEDIEHSLAYLYQPPNPFGPTTEGVWVPARDVLHVAINRVSGCLRGRSDLAPILPYLRRYREWLDDRILQNKLKTAVVWDVTVNGADKSDIDRLRAENANPPARGTVLFHSDGESWKPVHPDIDAGDAAPDGRAIRLMIAIGAILPEHFLGEGGNANRATAAEMGLPSFKRFQRRQAVMGSLITRLIARVVHEAQQAGRLGPRIDRTFHVHFEEISRSSEAEQAAHLDSVTRAIALANDRGWGNTQQAQRLWWRFAGQADESAPQSHPDAA